MCAALRCVALRRFALPRAAPQGKASRQYFNRRGQLRHFQDLESWGLHDVLADKYRLPPSEARLLADFLLPMLALDPARRAPAAACLKHPWLQLNARDLLHLHQGTRLRGDGDGGRERERERETPEMIDRDLKKRETVKCAVGCGE